jgi:hypothetical protein
MNSVPGVIQFESNSFSLGFFSPSLSAASNRARSDDDLYLRCTKDKIAESKATKRGFY